MSKTQPAVIYARVSTREQEQSGYSIPAQLELLRDYAKREDYEIIKEFQEAESASQPGRPAFDAMLKFVKKQRATILVEKIDRLYRNLWDPLKVEKSGAMVRFVKEGLSLGPEARAADKLIHNINVAMAANYSDNLSEEVRKGQAQKLKSGKYPGGLVPLGYLRDRLTKEPYLDPDRAPIIRTLYKMYATGEHSIDSLCDYARMAGLTFRKSQHAVTRSEIDRILKRPFYVGDCKWNGEVFRADHTPLVDRMLFDSVQEQIQRRSNGKHGTRNHLFSRMIVCGDCGHAVTAERKKNKYTYYHCTGYGGAHKPAYVTEEELERQFADIVKAVVLPWDWFEHMSECIEREFGNQAAANTRAKQRLERQKHLLLADMKWAYEDRLRGSITNDFFASVHTDQQRRLDAISHQLGNLEGIVQDRFELARKSIELSKQADQLYLRANREGKRELLKSLLSNCELHGRTLRPTYRKAFALLAKGIESGNWRGDRDSNSLW